MSAGRMRRLAARSDAKGATSNATTTAKPRSSLHALSSVKVRLPRLSPSPPRASMMIATTPTTPTPASGAASHANRSSIPRVTTAHAKGRAGHRADGAGDQADERVPIASTPATPARVMPSVLSSATSATAGPSQPDGAPPDRVMPEEREPAEDADPCRPARAPMLSRQRTRARGSARRSGRPAPADPGFPARARAAGARRRRGTAGPSSNPGFTTREEVRRKVPSDSIRCGCSTPARSVTPWTSKRPIRPGRRGRAGELAFDADFWGRSIRPTSGLDDPLLSSGRSAR